MFILYGPFNSQKSALKNVKSMMRIILKIKRSFLKMIFIIMLFLFTLGLNYLCLFTSVTVMVHNTD
jgi:hypothetical protein